MALRHAASVLRPSQGAKAKADEEGPALERLYPTWGEWALGTVVHFGRTALYTTVFYFLVFRPFIFLPAVQWYADASLDWVPGPVKSFFDGPDAPGHTTLRASTFITLFLAAVHAFTYWPLNTLDYLAFKFGWFQRFQEPRTARMVPPTKLVLRTIVEAAVAQVVGIAMVFLMTVYCRFYPSPFGGRPYLAMTFVQAFGHFLGCQLVNEVGFYFAHRTFHTFPQLYRLHKQHHQYTGVIGFASEYAHPLEQLLANFAPTLAYIFWYSPVIGVDLAAMWLVSRFLETYEIHSGMYFKGTWLNRLGLFNAESARFHDWHHSDNRGNYGWPWIDYLFGTMDTYAAHVSRDLKERVVIINF